MGATGLRRRHVAPIGRSYRGCGMKLCGFEVGPDRPFFLIAGPCVVESEQLQLDVAGRL
jgi:2-dehydro-3-deoxyphosphooctonate aldolase (KDO 8-P synthase)